MRFLILACAILLSALAYFNWDRLEATVKGECLVELAGTMVHVPHVVQDCTLQVAPNGEYLVFTSADRLFIMVCGIDRRPEWGNTFMYFERNRYRPGVSTTWEEGCVPETNFVSLEDWPEDWPDEYRDDHQMTLARYLWSGNRDGHLSLEEAEALRADFVSATQHVVSAERLTELVNEFRGNW